MADVKWTEDLSVGVELIDQQHQMLIQHINSLKKAVAQQQGPKEVADTLSFLIDYTDFHFSMEERNMEEHSYPGLAAHKAKHEEFKATLSSMEEEFSEDGATPLLAESIDTLLATWLLKHIRVVDVELGEFLRANAIAITEA
jgi:hemerythrin